MKYLLLLIIVSCSNQPIKTRHTKAIVHDYVIMEAVRSCGGPDRFHFIVEVSETVMDGNKYPCSVKYIFGCQDGTKIPFNDGGSYCYIGESQIEDAISGRSGQ